MSLRSLVAPLALALLSCPVACSSSADDPITVLDSGVTADTSLDETTNDGGTDTSVATDTAVAADTAIADTRPDASGDVAVDASDALSLDAADVRVDGDAADAKPCTPGAIESESCGKCGTRSRLCDTDKTWLDYGSCSEETGLCTPGESSTAGCGRCGTRPQTCSATCEWTTGVCTGEKGCAAGSVETQYGTCLDTTKVKRRTCSTSCEWSDWSDCL